MFRRLAAALVLLLLCAAPAGAVGFQWATAPDPDGEPLKVAIWYPSAALPQIRQIGPFEMNVAVDAQVSGRARGLIVMSHGTGGSALSSYDTAVALAEAGYVVAAVAHAGDNYLDQATSFSGRNFVNRPRQISRVLDFMLRGWVGHGVIDPRKIGFFGHSAGGATGLLLSGGIADWGKAGAFCVSHPKDWGCRQAIAKSPTGGNDGTTTIAAADPRIRAVAIAAPALAHIFEPNGLTAITIPVQLWVAGKDDIVTDAPAVRPLLTHGLEYHSVAQAGHFAFLAPCSAILRGSAPEICGDPKGFERAKFLRRFQTSLVGFYRVHLK